jgi:NAD(P)-dependent dehydrogenase (short-subunit alcohol dehydrogenase family)|tara:strand:- start:6463 stop:7260 length:798 start_codon:yes stop_codon:yes gene_type:complete
MDVKKLFDLTGKVVIITGAAGMLGSRYAYGLSKQGANVVLADINFSECKKIEKDIKNSFETNPYSIKLDLTKIKSIESMVSNVLKKYSKIDVLINNAAYQGNPKIRTAGFEKLSLDIWQQAIDVNLTGVFLCCQNIGKQMLKQKSGNIINIASTYGLVGPDQRIYGKSGQNSAAFYAATKSAILNLTRYLSAYWQRTGIRVNTFSPGGVENKQDTDFIKKYSSRTPLKRMARKDEYVGSLIFLASDASSYMTGSNLVVDGGWTAW